MEPKRPYFYALDCVRFGAALAVAFFHLGFYAWAAETSPLDPMFRHVTAFHALAPVSWFGWVGVEVFFVLSGFVIANSANGATPLSFLKGRILRLYPAVWICATISLLAILNIGQVQMSQLLVPYIHAMGLWPTGGWIDAVYWTLAVEITFYALVFLLLASGHFSRLTYLAWAITLVNAFYFVTIQTEFFPRGGWVYYHSSTFLLRHGSVFAVGIWMWLTSRRLMKVSDWVGLAFAFLVASLAIWDQSHFSLGVTMGYWVGWPILAWGAVVLAQFAFTRWPEKFTPAKMRSRKTLREIGRSTYPLYLIHAMVGAGLIRVYIEWGLRPFAAFPAALLTVVAAALVISLYFEPKLRKLLAWALDFIEVRIARIPLLGFALRPGGTIG